MIHPGVYLICYMEYDSFGVLFLFFTLFLFTPNDFAKFTCLFQFLLCYTWRERKKKYLWIYVFETEHNVLLLFFVSFTFLFVCFSMFFLVLKNSSFDPLLDQPFFILSPASSNLYLFFCFSLSHWKSIVHKYIHVQNNFSFFSLSLSLFKAILPIPANSWISRYSEHYFFSPLYSRYILVRCSS